MKLFNIASILILSLLFSSLTYADEGSGYFEMTTRLKTAYNLTIDFRLDEAQKLINDEKRQYPENLMSYFIEDYHDLIKIFVSQDKATFNELEKNKNYRLNKLENGDKSSPYYLYTLAEVRLHWSLNRSLFGEHVTAIREVKKSYKMLVENQEKFPDFKANLKGIGLLKTIFGSVPDNYQWAANMLGLKGTTEDGIRDIRQLLAYAKNNEFLFEKETVLLYSYMLLQMGNEKDLAWELISNPKYNPRRSTSIVLIQTIVGIYTGHCQEAITVLQNRPTDKRYYPVPQLEFFLAKAKTLRGDSDAKTHLLNYLKNPQGQHFIKATYQYLAWNELIKGNESGYKTYAALGISKGARFTYDDDKAHNELSGDMPNATLLKVRMLYDGGFYKKAKTMTASLSEADFLNKTDQRELIYRKGRIEQALKSHTLAITYFNQVIESDSNKSTYEGASAAMQIALIYEKQRKFSKAKEYYEICLSFNPDRYKFTLQQQAKAGLDRVQKRS